MRFAVVFLSVLAILLLPSPGWSAATSPPVQVEERSSTFTSYTLAARTPLFILLQSPINTDTNSLNDPIEAAVALDIYLDAHKLISKDARLEGVIATLEKPIEGRNAIVGFRFTELLLPNGDKIPIQAYVKTERPDHTFGGELTEGTKPRLVTHRVIGLGAYNKVVLGGPRRMGEHIEFLPGERWTLILEQPVSIVLPNPE